MNKPLFRKIIKAIRAEPLRMSMSTWANTRDSIAPCGTAGCIAGFATVLSQSLPKNWTRIARRLKEKEQTVEDFNFHDEGQKALRITDQQAEALFYVENWPSKFWSNFDECGGIRQEEAKVVIARIEHFIKTGK